MRVSAHKNLWIWSILLLLILNGLILQKETIIRHGVPLLLELAPVDPRSLMQGDYMALDYAMIRSIDETLIKSAPLKGHLVIRLDKDGVGRYKRLYKGEALQDEERLLVYRRRGTRFRGRIKIATDSFFFQEGTGKSYENAKYGIFQLSEQGVCILIGLAGEDRKQIKTQSS